jgi:hypothetical protein
VATKKQAMRIQSFAAPHKGLRNVIGQFSFRLGHTDFQNEAQLLALKDLGNELFTLLNDHVHTENEYTLKHLEERAKGASRHDKEDHERLELIQGSLQKQLQQFTGKESLEEIHDLYLRFSMFQSEYLEHIYEEETVTELLMQQYFTDEELAAHRIGIMQRLEFSVLLLWIKYIIPAQMENESIGMLSGFKAGTSPEAFQMVLATVKTEMSPARFESLVAKL